MLYPRETIEEVRQGNDIVGVVSSYIELRQRGGSFLGLCPFHKEKTPSFNVSPDRQLYHCFGCGASGNVYSFVMQIENYNFYDAVRFLADRIHFILPEKDPGPEYKRLLKQKEDIYAVNKEAAKIFHEALVSPEGDAAAAYLNGRGVNKKMQIKFGLGYCPKNPAYLTERLISTGRDNSGITGAGLMNNRFGGRLIFPIFDASGRVTGFGGRSLSEGGPKYINSPETPVFEKSKNLYGINFARLSRKKTFLLAEGYLDVIALHRHGYDSAVASLGTAFNREHAKLLKRFCEGVVLIFDGDEAGASAVKKAVPELESVGLKIKIMPMTEAKDPDEFLRAYGPEEFSKKLSQAVSTVSFAVAGIKSKYDLSKTEDKVSFTTEAAAFLSGVPNMIERDAYIKDIASETGISRGAIAAETEKLSKSRAPEYNPDPNPRLSYAERGLLNERGVVEAVKALIRLSANDEKICVAIKNNLAPEEIVFPVHSALLSMVYETRESGRNIVPAELVNNFHDAGEQKTVSDVFLTEEKTEAGDAEKTVGELIKKIKSYYVEYGAARASDPGELVRYTEMKKNIANLNIRI